MPADLAVNSPVISACQCMPAAYTPVWLMRQAGRFMPEYRKIREKVGFLELCKDPDLVTEVTMLPIDQLGVDAAIIFADILLLLEPLGIDLSFAKGEGPIIHNPIVKEADAYRLGGGTILEDLSYVFAGLRQTRKVLGQHIPLIGFCGAPFTLAAYLIEGGAVDNLTRTKTFMYQYPVAWQHLMKVLTAASSEYLLGQVNAGAQILQIFDSWLGYLSPADFSQYVLPYSKQLVAAVRDKAPVIYFGTGTGNLLSLIKETQCQVIGLDWRVDLAYQWAKLDHKIAIQGNLDPVVLLSNKENITGQVKKILSAAGNRPGHIFNLGHGILPETPVENVKHLVNIVHELSRKSGQ